MSSQEANITGKKPYIEDLGLIHSLTTLSLSGVDLSNDDMKVISGLTNLTWFNNADALDRKDYFDDIGLGYFRSLTKLTYLEIYSNNKITTEGFAVFLAGTRLLTNLVLTECKAVDTGIFALTEKLINLKELVFQDMNYDFNTENANYLNFIRARPDVKVIGIRTLEEVEQYKEEELREQRRQQREQDEEQLQRDEEQLQRDEEQLRQDEEQLQRDDEEESEEQEELNQREGDLENEGELNQENQEEQEE
jgi:hypothetical protein